MTTKLTLRARKMMALTVMSVLFFVTIPQVGATCNPTKTMLLIRGGKMFCLFMLVVAAASAAASVVVVAAVAVAVVVAAVVVG